MLGRAALIPAADPLLLDLWGPRLPPTPTGVGTPAAFQMTLQQLRESWEIQQDLIAEMTRDDEQVRSGAPPPPQGPPPFRRFPFALAPLLRPQARLPSAPKLLRMVMVDPMDGDGAARKRIMDTTCAARAPSTSMM